MKHDYISVCPIFALQYRAVPQAGAGSPCGTLVVLAIISILLSVLVPAAGTQGSKLHRQSAATQSSHGIAQLHDPNMPSILANIRRSTSTDAFKQLINKGYLTSADFSILPNGVQRNSRARVPQQILPRECLFGTSWEQWHRSEPAPLFVSQCAERCFLFLTVPAVR